MCSPRLSTDVPKWFVFFVGPLLRGCHFTHASKKRPTLLSHCWQITEGCTLQRTSKLAMPRCFCLLFSLGAHFSTLSLSKGFRKRVPGSGREAIPRARGEDLSRTTVHAKLVAFGSRARRLKAPGRWAAPGLLPTGVVEEAAAKEVVEEAFVKEGVASPGGRRRSRCQESRPFRGKYQPVQ